MNRRMCAAIQRQCDLMNAQIADHLRAHGADEEEVSRFLPPPRQVPRWVQDVADETGLSIEQVERLNDVAVTLCWLDWFRRAFMVLVVVGLLSAFYVGNRLIDRYVQGVQSHVVKP